MAGRTTDKDLEEYVKEINRVLKITDRERKFFIQHAYGKPRLCKYVGSGGRMQDVSPRLPMSVMLNWLQAFLFGIHTGIKSAKE